MPIEPDESVMEDESSKTSDKISRQRMAKG